MVNNQIEVSSLGYNNIHLSWNVRHSNTSANREVLFYTLDKTAASPVWVEAGVYTATSGDSWLRNNSLGNISFPDWTSRLICSAAP